MRAVKHSLLFTSSWRDAHSIRVVHAWPVKASPFNRTEMCLLSQLTDTDEAQETLCHWAHHDRGPIRSGNAL